MFDRKTMNERMRAHRAWLDAAPGSWPAKRELTEALRGLIDTLSTTNADQSVLRDLTAEILDATERLREDMMPHGGVVGEQETGMVGGMETIHERSPLVGRSNPIAPPLELDTDPDAEELHGEVTFSRAYEGAPGCVHGGWVAAVLDEALGVACAFAGSPAMTGELTTRYLATTPIQQRLVLKARFDGREGRRVRSSGELYAGDIRVAEATGTFIAVDLEKFSRLLEEHRSRSEDDG